MWIAFALALAPAPQDAAPDASGGDEIIVTARNRKCGMQIARRILSDAEFKLRAPEWAAGRPLRILVPAGTSYKCLAKIMFRLHEHGVRRASFIDVPAG